MNLLLMFGVITAVILIWRLVGFTLRVTQTAPFWEQFFRFIPIAIFTALAVSSLYKETELLSLKFIALAVGGGIAWRTRQFGLGVLSGLAVLWLLVLFL